MFGNSPGDNKIVPLATRNRILSKLGFPGWISSIFPKYVAFKVVSVLNILYTVGIASTLGLCYIGQIHIKLDAVITLCISGLNGLCNVSYNVIYCLYWEQIDWFMRGVKEQGNSTEFC